MSTGRHYDNFFLENLMNKSMKNILYDMIEKLQYK